jgi:hypothetical protein
MNVMISGIDNIYNNTVDSCDECLLMNDIYDNNESSKKGDDGV